MRLKIDFIRRVRLLREPRRCDLLRLPYLRDWLERDAEALNEQNISAVKMATSEPVREPSEAGKFDLSARRHDLNFAYLYETILKCRCLERSRDILCKQCFILVQRGVLAWFIALAWLAVGRIRLCLTLLEGRDRVDVVHSNFNRWCILTGPTLLSISSVGCCQCICPFLNHLSAVVIIIVQCGHVCY